MSKQPELLPIYLAVGEDQLKRENVLKKIRSRVAAMGDIDFNSETLDGESTSGEAIISACNTLPFISEKRLVVVKNVEKLPKEAQEKLIEYTTAPSQTTVLMLLASKLAKNTRLYKALQKLGPKAIIDTAEKSRRETPAALRDVAVSKGVTLAPEAAEALVDAVGLSMLRLNTELDKIISSLAEGKHEIGLKDVEQLVVRTAEIKPWDLQDAFAKRDTVFVAQLLPRMYADGQSPHGLLAMIITRIRELISAKALTSRGYTSGQISSELKWPEWRTRNVVQWARGWSEPSLRSALVTAADLDGAIKSGTDPELGFQLWILNVLQER